MAMARDADQRNDLKYVFSATDSGPGPCCPAQPVAVPVPVVLRNRFRSRFLCPAQPVPVPAILPNRFGFRFRSLLTCTTGSGSSASLRMHARCVQSSCGLTFAGGFDGSMPLNTAECYDPKLGKWLEMPRMNQCRFGVGCAVLTGMVYAVGGSDGTNLRTVERYDPETNTWTVVAPMSTARWADWGDQVPDSRQSS